ncbi:hypothetical protein JTE90_006683 [Oedothorax gibbosus]|uniref:TELO2-interacting protein 1 n=1 Tax=Oedothorax gibbosus TaxID=931172 RepID=A0AAV6V4G3_9ARAC|nr:hypothetical protein JTE90_006683 [Oedothorax gibbosus]
MDKPECFDHENSANFERIQPLCAELVRNYSLENLKQLEQTLNTVNPKFINTFQEYLLFPIRIALVKNDKTESQLIKSLDIATIIFNKSELKSWPLFTSLITTVLQLISDPQHIDQVKNTSEELKLSTCECISSMIQNASEEVRQSIYKSSFSLPLAHALHTLVVTLRNERSKFLRRSILRTIGLLCYSKDFAPSRDARTEALASEALACYLPGISIGLANVVCGDYKQGESVIRMALKVLGDLIVITVNDSCPISKSTEASVNKSDQNAVCLVKDEKWFKEVASKLYILIEQTTILVTHEHWKVRRDYVNFAKSILLNCTKNLQNCVPVLLAPVFALSVDDHEGIAEQGQILIAKFSDKFHSMNSLTLCSAIEDELYKSASKLIRCKLSDSDDQKLFTLKCVYGCLQILGNSIDKILFSFGHLEKLLLSLLNLLEFESSFDMVEEISVDLDISSMNIMPRKRFCYFEKREILDAICSICMCLGKSNYNRLVIDYLIENMHTSEIFTLQSIFLIGCVVEGFPSDSQNTDTNVDLISDIIDELLSPELFDVPLHKVGVRAITYNEQSSIQVYNNNNVYQVCLILEAIEKCAKLLGKSFKVFLIKVLFSVMVKAGSTNYIVSQAGKICLYGIARYCDYNPRVELVRENADYLVNSIILNYHHFLYKPEMSAVLQVVLQESDGDMLPLFKDCINRLLKMLEGNQERALPIMATLKSVVVFVKKWYPSEKSHDSGLSTPVANECQDLKSYFLERNKKKEQLMEDYSSETSEVGTMDEEENVMPEEEKEEVPLHASIVAQILKQCSHFQSARNLQLRMLVLEVMELCILALSDFEREQHPLVHQLWNAFVRRFSEENTVVLQAFKVLLVIADECRDFVRVRCLKDVIPKLTSLLKKNLSMSLAKNYIRGYQWSNDCKLQLCVLSEIGGLFAKLEVTEKDIAGLAEVCLPYLEKFQAKVFREAALKTMKALATIDPDAVWFYFNSQYSETQVLTPPHESLQPVKFPHAVPIDPQFKIEC